MPPGRQRWASTVIVIAVVYGVVGIVTGTLAGMAASSRAQFLWRLSAFVISAVVFAAHLAYEHFRIGSPPRRTAWHTSLAVALGALLLALMANIHDLQSGTGYRPIMLIALAAWPLGTAVPAFIAAFGVTAVLGLFLGGPKDPRT
jgi:hypothetical protein